VFPSVFFWDLCGCTSKQPHDVSQVACLKQPNSRDPGGTCRDAGTSVLQGDTTERQHRNQLLTSLAQKRQADTGSVGRILFLEHGSKHGEVRTFGSRAGDLFNCVARNPDYRRIIPPRAPDSANVEGGDVLRPQVYAIRTTSDRDIHS